MSCVWNGLPIIIDQSERTRDLARVGMGVVRTTFQYVIMSHDFELLPSAALPCPSSSLLIYVIFSSINKCDMAINLVEDQK